MKTKAITAIRRGKRPENKERNWTGVFQKMGRLRERRQIGKERGRRGDEASGIKGVGEKASLDCGAQPPPGFPFFPSFAVPPQKSDSMCALVCPPFCTPPHFEPFSPLPIFLWPLFQRFDLLLFPVRRRQRERGTLRFCHSIVTSSLWRGWNQTMNPALAFSRSTFFFVATFPRFLGVSRSE